MNSDLDLRTIDTLAEKSINLLESTTVLPRDLHYGEYISSRNLTWEPN
jgi:hypothetical protein